jgi:hypothetical protein
MGKDDRKEEVALAWTIDDAVSNKELKDAKIFVREVSFYLGYLTLKIRIRLFRYPGDKEIYFDQSHFIQTPEQARVHIPELKSDNNEAYALSHAVDGLTHSYQDAVAKGHEPADDWLILNEDF